MLFSFVCLVYSSDEASVLRRRVSCDSAQVSAKRSRLSDCPESQVVAAYFMNLMQKNKVVVYKTSVNKFMYFANGLNYALYDCPLLESYSFIAHQFGPFADDVSSCYEELKRDSSESAQFDFLDPAKKLICDTTFALFNVYTPSQLSSFTHEPETPWSQVRTEKDFRFQDVHIPCELDQRYFSRQDVIKRFFIDPFLARGAVLHEHPVFSMLLEKHSGLFVEYLRQEIEKVKKSLSPDKVIYLSELIESFEYISNNFGKSLKSLELRQRLTDVFVSQSQNILEGALAETVFDFGLIENNEIELFFDEFFRNRTVIAANVKSLPALYYLQRIFETLSDEDRDLADQYAQEVNRRLLNLCTDIVAFPFTVDMADNWQILYDRVLAYFYKNNFDEAIKSIDQALALSEFPHRYRKDLLKRGFYITRNSRYADIGIEQDFKEFYMHKAMGASSQEEAVQFCEQGILEANVPEAFFEVGRSILKQGYKVPPTSKLWGRMSISLVGDDLCLGEALLKEAITLGVQKALTLYASIYDQQKTLVACDLAKNKPWAFYQKAKTFEQLFMLDEAISEYEKAGILLGYLDAARLSFPSEKSKQLQAVRRTYKERLVQGLYDDFRGETQ